MRNNLFFCAAPALRGRRPACRPKGSLGAAEGPRFAAEGPVWRGRRARFARLRGPCCRPTGPLARLKGPLGAAEKARFARPSRPLGAAEGPACAAAKGPALSAKRLALRGRKARVAQQERPAHSRALLFSFCFAETAGRSIARGMRLRHGKGCMCVRAAPGGTCLWGAVFTIVSGR